MQAKPLQLVELRGKFTVDFPDFNVGSQKSRKLVLWRICSMESWFIVAVWAWNLHSQLSIFEVWVPVVTAFSAPKCQVDSQMVKVRCTLTYLLEALRPLRHYNRVQASGLGLSMLVAALFEDGLF